MFSTEESREMSGMGFTVMESFVDKVFVESEPDKGNSGDFDQISGYLLWRISMCRSQRKIHMN